MPDRKFIPCWSGAVLHLDVDVTRRKRFHYLMDAEGELLGVHRKMTDVLETMREASIEAVLVLTEHSAYTLRLQGRSDLHPMNGGFVPAFESYEKELSDGENSRPIVELRRTRPDR